MLKSRNQPMRSPTATTKLVSSLQSFVAVGWGLALEVDVGLVGGCPAVVQSVGTRGVAGP